MQNQSTAVFPGRSTIASYPGPPMFFNVAREKSGRPGRSGDVIVRGYVYPAYSPTRTRAMIIITASAAKLFWQDQREHGTFLCRTYLLARVKQVSRVYGSLTIVGVMSYG